MDNYPCVRQHARTPSLVPRSSVCDIQVKTRRLETERDLLTRLTDDVTNEITEDYQERLCVSAADQSEGRLLQTLRSSRSAPRLLQTVTMDDLFCFRKQTTYSKYQKVNNYGKLHDLLT